MSRQTLEWTQKFNELLASRTPFVMITLVDARGSTPQEQGARALVTREGLAGGTVGGGKVEAKAIAHAQAMLDAKERDFVVWNLQRDVGMTCGGEVKFFFEVFVSQEWTVAVFGAGHVAQALIPLLLTLDCRVICIDSRREWLDRLPRSPKLEIRHESEPARAVRILPPDTFILSMTQGHAHDTPILAEIFKSGRKPPYLGVIGSRSKSIVMRSDLQKLGVSREDAESFYCPVGLPVGDSTPAEIAISIAAQLLHERDRLGFSQQDARGRKRVEEAERALPQLFEPHHRESQGPHEGSA